MDFKEFIKPEMLILIPVLYLIGVGLKCSTLVRDNLIPLILGLLGIFFALLGVVAAGPVQGNIWTAVFTSVTQGVLCAGSAVYANQLYKQAKGKKAKS